jgi:hypothetical protein
MRSSKGRPGAVEEGAQTILLEELRRVFGLESIKDAEGNVISEAPLPVWANFQQRALDVAMLEGQQENRLEDQARIDRTLEASACGCAEFCN